jgi:hypothetical protein
MTKRNLLTGLKNDEPDQYFADMMTFSPGIFTTEMIEALEELSFRDEVGISKCQG